MAKIYKNDGYRQANSEEMNLGEWFRVNTNDWARQLKNIKDCVEKIRL